MGVIGSGPVQNRVATGFVRGSSLHVFEPRRVALEIPTSKQLTRSSGARSGFFQRFLDILYATRCVASEMQAEGMRGLRYSQFYHAPIVLPNIHSGLRI